MPRDARTTPAGERFVVGAPRRALLLLWRDFGQRAVVVIRLGRPLSRAPIPRAVLAGRPVACSAWSALDSLGGFHVNRTPTPTIDRGRRVDIDGGRRAEFDRGRRAEFDP